MMKEIGSEFWGSELNHRSIPINVPTYLSGRTALAAIIIDMMCRGVKSVCIPDYCCESMIEPFLCQGMKVGFYPVCENKDSLFFLLDDIDNYDAVLLVNFFGFMSNEIIEYTYKCKRKNKIIIFDQTHSVFFDDFEIPADYVFGSYRKWTGLELGFVFNNNGKMLNTWKLNSSGKRYLSLREQARQVKEKFVKDGFRDESLRREQISLFQAAEKSLEKDCFSDTDDNNKKSAAALNVELIKEKRKENMETVYRYFSQLCYCKPMFAVPANNIIPLNVPIIVSDGKRDSLREYLREHGIFCPVHWPVSSLHNAGGKALNIYRNELSLICDQRYDREDIVYMMETVKQWERTV